MRLELIYIPFLIILAIFTYLFVDPNLFYFKNVFTGFAFEQRIIITLFFSSIVCTFFIFYYLFLKNQNINKLKKWIFLSVIILFFAYPAFLSYDIFNYIFTSKVLFHYFENPYIIMPIEFLGDPLLQFTHAPNKVALYGPLWVFLTGIPYLLGFNNFLITLFNFKALSILFYLGVCYLIYKITDSSKATAFFALNPLVLIESAASAHNDSAMMFFTLLSFYVLKKEKHLTSLVFLLMSILIKYATIFLFPVYAYYFLLRFQNKRIDWSRIFGFAQIMMLLIFFLSFVREEIYPWYAIWFLVFTALISKKNIFYYVSLLLSFVLMFRYVPFMLLGTYFGPTPFIKISVTFIPLIVLLLVYYLNNRNLPRIK